MSLVFLRSVREWCGAGPVRVSWLANVASLHLGASGVQNQG